MGKVKIYSSFEQNAVFFEGTTIDPKFIGVPIASEHPSEGDRIIIKRNDRFIANTTEFRKIFKRLRINRIQNKNGENLVADLGYDRTAVLSYLNSEFNKTFADVAGDAIAEFDWYVSADYTEGDSDGTRFKPFTDVQSAVDAASDTDSIFIKGGTYNITSKITIPTAKGLNLFGDYNTVLQYAGYHPTNENIIEYIGDGTKSMSVRRITFKNSGEYGIKATKLVSYEKIDCTFINNGWDGLIMNTILPSAVSGGVGYDSLQTELQSFYAGGNASSGGACRIEEVTTIKIIGNTFTKNLRGCRIQDCGVNGSGVVTRNVTAQNIEAGIYLAAGTVYYGCQNITVMMNSSAYNANNGALIIGGLNNKLASNEFFGNWNAGTALWAAGNTTVRDAGIYNNNRSEFNGIGNIGDAKGSVFIGDAYNLLGTTISVNPDARFIAEIIDTQIHYTGSGSNTEKVGVYLDESLGLLPANDKNIIRIDNIGFIAQDYDIDMSACDITNLKVILGNNTYYKVEEKAIKPPLAGNYFELPFSNFCTDLKYADFSVDGTGNIKILEGVGGARLNPYKVNDLSAVAFGSKIRIMLRDSSKVQFEVPVSGCSIDGTLVNSVLSQAIVQINSILTNAAGFISTDNFVSGFDMIGNNLTLTLQDGTSYTVDVTTLGVDENKFVSSGVLNGSSLELTMNDSSVVSIDASNMINGSQLPARSNDWFISYGVNAGDEVEAASIVASLENKQPFYNGDFLEKGEEYVWTHNDNGYYVLGIYTGAEETADEVDITFAAKWSNLFRFTTTGTNRVAETSVGVDVASRFANGYDLTNNTVLALTYDSDNYLKLYDVSGSGRVLIGQSDTALVGDSQVISFGGQNQPNAKFPIMIKRYAEWEIVHDFDNSETSIIDGLEQDTVIKSILSVSAGEKIMVNLNFAGRAQRFGIGYNAGSSGVVNAHLSIESSFSYGASEQLVQQDNAWDFNTSASGYNAAGPNWSRGSGVNPNMISLVYNLDNSLDLYSEDLGEVIATKKVDLDGSPLHFFFGVNEAATPSYIPSISKQAIGAGSQPVISFAPDISDQSFDVTEGETFSIQIALDSGSDIVNQFVEQDAPAWAVLNQSTGVFMGTAPAWADNGDSYTISCKAANAVGGHTNFTVTINVVEQTYTNTKSLRFEDGVSSYLGGNAALITELERAANGSGSSDAWTISLWLKGSTESAGQTVLYFGGNDLQNEGHIELRQTNHNGLKRLRLRYGSTNNYIQLTTPSGSITPSSWQHILVTYDGSLTGVASGDINDYYNAFNFYIDGVLQNTSNNNANNGFNGELVGDNYRIGRYQSGQYLKDMVINQLAIWGSDQSTNVSIIYNSGVTQDLSLLSETPDHYYEIEDSVSTIPDLIGTAHLVGYNFNLNDLVTDTP